MKSELFLNLGILFSDKINIKFLEQLDFFIAELSLPIKYNIIDTSLNDIGSCDCIVYFGNTKSIVEYLDSYSLFCILVDKITNYGSIVPYKSMANVYEFNSLIIILKLLSELQSSCCRIQKFRSYNIENDLLLNDKLRAASYILFELLNYSYFDLNIESVNKFKITEKYNKKIIYNYSEIFLGGKQEYSKENSLQSEGSTTISFDLHRFSFLDVNRIRFDPHTETCVISNCKFSLEYADGEIIDLDNYSSNADLVKYGKYYFNSYDSQFYFHFTRINPRYLHCSFIIDSLEDSAFYHEEKWFDEIKGMYFESINTNNSINLNLNECQNNKGIGIHLGPRSTNIDMTHNLLLDNLSTFIKNKIIYPTHQRELFDIQGHGSLFTLFSKQKDKPISFDLNKTIKLLNNLYSGDFNYLFLSSANFLEDNRLEQVSKYMPSANYIYYLRNLVISKEVDYKNAILYGRETRKFNQQIFSSFEQFKHMVTMLKNIEPERLILRHFDETFLQPDLLIKDLLSSSKINTVDLELNFNIKNQNYELSHLAIEFKRIANHYPIGSLNGFLNECLVNYSKGFFSFTFFEIEQQKIYVQVISDRLSLICDILDYSISDSIFEQIKKLNCTEFIEQSISKAEVIDVLHYLMSINSQNAEDLLNIFTKSVNIIIDNDEFRVAITEFNNGFMR